MGLEVEVDKQRKKTGCLSTTNFELPEELPSVEEEKQLREMVQEHKRLNEIAEFFGKSPASIKMKISRLKLVVVVRQIQHTTTSNKLPSVENAWHLKNRDNAAAKPHPNKQPVPKENHGVHGLSGNREMAD